ncbi:menaquinone biosynthesis decarboxylase [Candidatus Methylacidithermus pantelleriae]|uniref:3-polyprenyl-4-hydroxybenzoate carboxy-lyase n=1 Tax=Candidatus Methylacidithermus pantelleriae TaxID=2744239 RepID=A0A8J2BHJ6_9BACT|nr:menaquinone biosynthesis decarboxylase [Candidatus Methylacidithermus pantelleriae]CAF0689759.1 3-polyprenyl-4-hydroxybenzoate carboxy-lyase [Candidatus Methylacidithermus pantelleriae]
MPYDGLAQFVRRLEEEKELVRITEPVRTELEVTALADREMKTPGGGKALLLERPVLPSGQMSRFPLLVNAFGSWRRMALALGCDNLEELVQRIRALLTLKPPATMGEVWQTLQKGLELWSARSYSVNRAPCQELVSELQPGSLTLEDLPILKCWPEDAGPFLTLPQVFTRDPLSGSRNVGMYRMQVYDGKTCALHWQLHKVGARQWETYKKLGQPMPVAVCLGGDPVLTFAATAPLPDGIDEVQFAGFLRKKAIPMVKCRTIELEVPAEADIVLEGYVDPSEPLRMEGPFGDHTGFYSPPEPYPVFHLCCLTCRKDAVYPATIVGIPPMEDFYLGGASVRLFLPILQATLPELVDLALPAEGVFHNLVFASIRKRYPYQAYKVMYALWGMGQMMFSKILVVVDQDVNVHDTSSVLFHLGANIDPQRDTIFVKAPADALDHAPSLPNVGSHMGIDATRKLPGEGYSRPWPRKAELPSSLREEVYRRFPRAW